MLWLQENSLAKPRLPSHEMQVWHSVLLLLRRAMGVASLLLKVFGRWGVVHRHIELEIEMLENVEV